MTSTASITHSVGNDQAADSNDWQNVVSHAKAMQHAIERYTGDYLKIQVGKDMSISANWLSKSGNAILTFVNAIAETVDPLIKSLNAETPLDVVSEISKKIATEQEAAIHALSKSLSERGTQSNSDSSEETTVPAVPASSLPPDVQAIKDGFEKMMDGKIDPRMGFGKIPPQFLQKKET